MSRLTAGTWWSWAPAPPGARALGPWLEPGPSSGQTQGSLRHSSVPDAGRLCTAAFCLLQIPFKFPKDKVHSTAFPLKGAWLRLRSPRRGQSLAAPPVVASPGAELRVVALCLGARLSGRPPTSSSSSLHVGQCLRSASPTWSGPGEPERAGRVTAALGAAPACFSPWLPGRTGSNHGDPKQNRKPQS